MSLVPSALLLLSPRASLFFADAEEARGLTPLAATVAFRCVPKSVPLCSWAADRGPSVCEPCGDRQAPLERVRKTGEFAKGV